MSKARAEGGAMPPIRTVRTVNHTLTADTHPLWHLISPSHLLAVWKSPCSPFKEISKRVG